MEIILCNGYDEEIKIEVEYDYQPFESMTWDYPGCPEQATIYSVIIAETGQEICLLPDVEKEISEKILEILHEGEY
jgi:signal recognition particle subunit SEC65